MRRNFRIILDEGQRCMIFTPFLHLKFNIRQSFLGYIIWGMYMKRGKYSSSKNIKD